MLLFTSTYSKALFCIIKSVVNRFDSIFDSYCIVSVERPIEWSYGLINESRSYEIVLSTWIIHSIDNSTKQSIIWIEGRNGRTLRYFPSLSLSLSYWITVLQEWNVYVLEKKLRWNLSSLLKSKEGLAVPIRPRNFPIWLTQTIFGGCRHIAKLSLVPSLSRTYLHSLSLFNRLSWRINTP